MPTMHVQSPFQTVKKHPGELQVQSGIPTDLCHKTEKQVQRI